MRINWLARKQDFFTVFDLPLAYLVIITTIVLWIQPLAFIPDWLRLSQKNPEAILDLILNISASILGIVVAILILGFELLKQRLGKLAVRFFFNNKDLQKLVTLLTLDILLSFIARLIFHERLSSNETTVLYFLSFLFLFTVINVMPLVYRIINNTTSADIISSIKEKINFDDIEHFYRNNGTVSDLVQKLEENPVFIITEIAINHLRSLDPITTHLILSEYADRIDFLYNKYEVNRSPASNNSGILFPFEKIIKEAMTIGKENVVLVSAESLFTLHKHFLQAKKNIIDLTAFAELERKTLKKIYGFNQDVYISLLGEQRKLIETILTFCLPGGEIEPVRNPLVPEYIRYTNNDDAQKWRLIESYTITLLSYFDDVKADDKNTSLSITREYNYFLQHLFRMDLPERQKNALIAKAFMNYNRYVENLLQAGHIKYAFDLEYPDTDTIANYITTAVENYSKFIHNQFCSIHTQILSYETLVPMFFTRHPLVILIVDLSGENELTDRSRTLILDTLVWIKSSKDICLNHVERLEDAWNSLKNDIEYLKSVYLEKYPGETYIISHFTALIED